MTINLPTAITISRFLMVPVFIAVAEEHPVWGAIVFSAASLTDLLDGYLARRSKQVTKLGIILDPLADKFLVIGALLVFLDMALVKMWMVAVIVIREFLVTALRLVALEKNLVIPAETGGKVKMGFQIAAILTLLVDYSGILEFIPFLYGAGVICLWTSMILGVVSGAQYFVRFTKTAL